MWNNHFAFSKAGLMEFAYTFSITSGTVTTMYGFTSCMALSSVVGEGVFPRK